MKSRRGLFTPIAPSNQHQPIDQGGFAVPNDFSDHILSLKPKLDVNRRNFVKMGSLATGFALAAQPICAQTVIKTDTAGIVTGDARIPVADVGSIPGYVAYPDKPGVTFPTVLVVQEIFGVHEWIKDVCRRLAKMGYFAVAPSLYERQGDPTKITEIPQIVSTIVSKVPDRQVMSDLDATVAWAKAWGKADTDKLAVTGFCWGGRIVWLYAAHNPGVKAGVAWYGPLVRPSAELQPKNPIDLVGDLKAPVLGLYGGADQGIPNNTVDQMQAALKAAHKPSEIHLYPDTPHGFLADYRPSYRKQQADDGWARLTAWFKKYGVA
jgi:carboxymethylenebutenolidase